MGGGMMGGGMMSGGVMGGGMMMGGVHGAQRCFKCEGKGFCHNSAMDHDKGPDERCFFCKDCDGCHGRGAIQGGVSYTRTHVAPMGGMMGPGMDGPQRCTDMCVIS